MGIEDCEGRIRGKSEKLYWWRSWEPRTRFAPLVDAPLWVEHVGGVIVEKILSRVSEKKWYEQNYFAAADDEIGLASILMSMYSQFASELDYRLPENLYIRGWYNIIPPMGSLPLHHHSIHENTFLSGNMLLTDSKIPTEYHIPGYSTYGGNFKPPSRAGTITLFPSWIEHKVGTNQEDHDRIALAWDLYTWESMAYCRDKNPEDEMMLSVPFL